MKFYVVIIVLGFFCASTSFGRVKADSFEAGVPKHFSLTGAGKLLTTPWHYKDGKQSLEWNWRSGDIIKIDNSLGNLNARGGYGNSFIATFGIWVYMPKPLDDVLRFEFRKGKKSGATFEISLNFKGWQRVYVNYNNPDGYIKFSGKVDPQADNILIMAPAKQRQGKICIDLIVYNGIWDPRRAQGPRVTSFVNTKINSQKYPLKELSNKETTGLKKVKKEINSYYVPEYPKTFNIAKTAAAIFNKYHIVKDKQGIRGEGIILERGISLFKTNVLFYTLNGINISQSKNYLKTYIHDLKLLSELYFHAKDQNLRKKIAGYFALMNEHLFEQGFNKYCGLNAFRYIIGSYGETTIVMHDMLEQYGILDESMSYIFSNYDYFAPINHEPINMDHFYHDTVKGFAFALMLDDPEKQVQALYFLRDKLSREIATDNQSNGFKIDGSGYHHIRHYPGYMRNAIRSIAKVTYALSDTPFQITPVAFDIIKKAVLNLRFCVNNRSWPVGLRGRHPELGYIIKIPARLVLSKINGKFDAELAAAYLRFHRNLDLEQQGFKAEPTPQGTLAMPYAGLVAFRHKEWLALAQAYGKYYYSTEITAGKNRFGRYTTNGTLDIIGPDGVIKSGTSDKGWDWNRMNGATVIYYPEAELRPKTSGTECLFTPYGFFGGISWRGKNGCFTMQIYGEPYDESFKGKKSYFMIGGKIIAIGSNITNNEQRYPTQTNLFQKALFKKETSTCIDGTNVVGFYQDKMLDKNSSHYILDPMGNGYYIPKGQVIATARKHQKRRDSHDKGYAEGDFSTAWIDHGTKPTGASYEYVILPYTTKEALASFAKLAKTGKAYKILQQNRYGHIIHDLIDDIYGAVFFTAQKVDNLKPVIKVSENCQIMFKKTADTLKIAVGNPDVNRPGKRWFWNASKLKPLQISLQGEWQLAKAVPGVKITAVNKSKTVIECASIDGKTFNFILNKRYKSKKRSY
jgi:chondroitin-sulfate-ABC endolyase/exolyase